MKKSLLLVLALTTAPASAEWTRVTANVEGDVYYMDWATLKPTALGGRIWGLVDLKKPKADGARSYKGLTEYDCQEERVRSLQYCGYPKSMGDGTPLRCDNSPGAWVYVIPDTIGASNLKLVCSALNPPGQSRYLADDSRMV